MLKIALRLHIKSTTCLARYVQTGIVLREADAEDAHAEAYRWEAFQVQRMQQCFHQSGLPEAPRKVSHGDRESSGARCAVSGVSGSDP